MPSSVYRFRVVNRDNESSQEWRVWAQGEDIYVGARGTTNAYKASFHETGQCSVGLTSELRATLKDDPSWAGKSRHFSSWTLDVSDAVAGQHLVDLLFSDSLLGTSAVKQDSKVATLESHHGTITLISILRLAEGTVMASDDPSFIELFEVALPSAKRLSVVRFTLPETSESLSGMRSQFLSHLYAGRTPSGRTYGCVPQSPWPPTYRVMLWDGRGPRKIWSEACPSKLLRLS